MEAFDPISVFFVVSAVFGASLLQAATGIGYGVIAGPVFLVLLSGTDALQISIMHNLLIAILLVSRIWRSADFRVLLTLGAGAIFGLPIGHLIVTWADISQIKILAALTISAAAIFSFRGIRRQVSPPSERLSHSPETAIVGVASGLLTSALAMPGPLAAAWMTARGWKMETIRATILVFFVFTFGSALAMQITLSGIAFGTWGLAIQLTPLLLAGVVAGHFLSKIISEKVFRIILTLVLSSTVIALVASI